MTRSPHRVQGLNHDAVAADWPPITLAEVQWLQARFPQLAGTAVLIWHSPRPLSAAALVQVGGRAVFIKRHHHSVRSPATLAEEHRFMAHLRARGLPVVQVLAGAEGHTAIAHGPWTYELHARGEGEDLYRDAHSWTHAHEVGHAHEAGRMLARLHAAAVDYHAPQRSTHLLVARDDLVRAADPVAALQAQLHERPALADYLGGQPWQAQLAQAIAPWHQGVARRLHDEPRLWAHNDWHVSNLLWCTEGGTARVQTVLDFGLASPTSALFDLATAIERNAVAWLQLHEGARAVRADIALALVEGYRQVLPLSAARVHLLADLLPLVHVDFALSEVEYFQGITGSPANADVAYHTFLRGHAEWFSTGEGQRLLGALHAAA